ncbi:hypothetical protein KEM48_009368 [Puccinia striiformis f. sp. tritici PST-130]|nr:hypothetical protein KEM48_009368 [Puccinia striiformis f. sp. tritici PST-130]
MTRGSSLSSSFPNSSATWLVTRLPRVILLPFNFLGGFIASNGEGSSLNSSATWLLTRLPRVILLRLTSLVVLRPMARGSSLNSFFPNSSATWLLTRLPRVILLQLTSLVDLLRPMARGSSLSSASLSGTFNRDCIIDVGIAIQFSLLIPDFSRLAWANVLIDLTSDSSDGSH